MEQNLVINKVFGEHNIRQREIDGYVCATDMCKAFDREFKTYYKSQQTKEYIDAVESDTGIPASSPVSGLIEIHKGGKPLEQGTWVHPLIATHLAQWLSPKFAIQVSKWVIRYLQGDITLVKDVIEQHDRVHDTTTTAVVNVVDNDLLRRKEIAAIEEKEIQNLRSRAEVKLLEQQIVEAQHRTIESQKQLITDISTMKIDDAHLFTAFKNSVMNTLAIPNQQTIENDITQNHDISEMIRSLHLPIPDNRVLITIGKLVAKEYKRRYPNQPILQGKKHVSGGIRNVKVYPRTDEVWIIPIIRRVLAAAKPQVMKVV